MPNGSFEEFDSCPIYYGDFYCKEWFTPTVGSSDFYNVCSIHSGVPQSDAVFQNPQDGESFAGIMTFDSIEVYREYISVKLKKKLIANEYYKFSMHTSLADSTLRASNNLGAYFSQNNISNFNTYGVLPYVPTINFDTLIIDAINWVPLEKIFQAKGDEEYLTIGNFLPDSQTYILQVLNDYNLSSWGAYYLIDNVSLVEYNWELPNVFTPNGDGINDLLILDFLPDDCTLKVLNRWGSIVFETKNPNIEFWDGKINDIEASEGTYFYVIEVEKNKKSGFIQLIR